MGRYAKEGWRLASKPGTKFIYVRFCHAKVRYFISTGKIDPVGAREEAKRIYAHIVQGGARPRRGVVRSLLPLPTICAQWLASISGVVDPETLKTYTRTYVRTHWLPFFPNLQTLVDPGRLGDYMRERLRRVLRTTVSKELSALHGLVAWCKEQGLIAEMPAWPTLPAKATGKRAGPQRAKANELTPEQVETAIDALPPWQEKAPRYPIRSRFRFVYETSLRPSSINLIRREDRKGEMLVLRDADDKARFGRMVPLSTRAREAWDEATAEPGKASALVFGRHDYRSHLAAAGEQIGVPNLASYDFRHARGTHLIDSGASLSGVAYILGHTQVTTTNKYVRPNRRAAEQAVSVGETVQREASAGLPAPSDSSENEGANFGPIAVHSDTPLERIDVIHRAKEGNRTPKPLRALEPESSEIDDSIGKTPNNTQKKTAGKATSLKNCGPVDRNSHPGICRWCGRSEPRVFHLRGNRLEQVSGPVRGAA